MSPSDANDRRILVDASVFITLAKIDLVDSLLAIDGCLCVPHAVVNEITADPAKNALSAAQDSGAIRTVDVMMELQEAADYLGRDLSDEDLKGYGHQRIEGDIALLALALQYDTSEPTNPFVVIVTDDKPLRKTCKALSIPVSGSIGVLVRAVERGDLDPAIAPEKLYAMDQVGARLSASLVRKAERLIEEATET